MLDSEQINALSSFVKSAPPGELSNVTAALQTIVDSAVKTGNQTPAKFNDVAKQLEPAYKEHNENQLTTVQLPGSSREVLVSGYNELNDGRYFDVESQTSFAFDHTTQKASDARSFMVEGKNADLIRSLNKALSEHANEHYPAASYGAFTSQDDREVSIVLVANKYSPNNFWNGRWRSIYKFDPSTSSLIGEIHVDVHYYEDGNVRLITSKNISIPDLSGSSLASEILSKIAIAEKQYQGDLNKAFSRLSEGAFKGLRRQLPITRQKIEWEKISGYRLGQDIGGGRSR